MLIMETEFIRRKMKKVNNEKLLLTNSRNLSCECHHIIFIKFNENFLLKISKNLNYSFKTITFEE